MAKRLSAVVFAAALASMGFASQAHAQSGWQCVTFARFFSGVQLFGDAWTWWQGAVGKYARGSTPQSGAILVFKPNGVMRLGHVAVVSHVLTDRIIQVTHANWSPIEGRRGKVEKDVTVVDVSTAGDWSQVKVWYNPNGDLGGTTYPTYGFIYNAPNNAAYKVTQVAMNTAVNTVAHAAASAAAKIADVAAGTTTKIADAATGTTAPATKIADVTAGKPAATSAR